MSRRRRVSLVLVVAAVVAACGGGDMTAGEAAKVLARAQCQRLARCNPGQLVATYGTEAACEAHKTPAWPKSEEPENCSRARVDACVRALGVRCDHIAECEGC